MTIHVPLYPAQELARHNRLDELQILDTPAEPEFDAIVELARRLLHCPIVLVSLIDDHRQWFKARCGVDAEGGPRDQSFCSHTILRNEIMVIEDARLDPRFAANPFVTGPEGVRFYAGAPLRPTTSDDANDRVAIGALCVIDTAPRTFGDDEQAVLRMLAGLVDSLIRSRALASAAVRSAEQARRAAAVIDRKNRQLRQAERMASIGSWRVDLADGTVEWSDEVFAIHGLPVGAYPPLEDALSFYPEADQVRIAAMLDRAISHGEAYQFESDLIAADGGIRRVRAVGEAERHEGKAVAVIGVFQDITDRHRHEARLRQVANTDSLTGLPNRRMFEERLAELTGRPDGAPFALLLIDLDGFKPVNDSLGHDAGDRVLRDMAERMRGRSFSQAFAARLGGDEFVMLVTRPRDCAELSSFVQSLLRELRCLAERDGVRLPVTASVGGAIFEGPPATGVAVLRDADLALYAAKRTQRGTGRISGSGDIIHPWGARSI